MREAGSTLVEIGVQSIFLTATLAVRDEAAFFTALRVPAEAVQVFRARTTRPNIEYRVVGAPAGELENITCQVVRRLQEELVEGKTLIYSRTIEQGKRLAEMLGCDMFFSGVDDTEGKRRRIEQWVKEKDGTIVSTNVLGLGLDIRDIRAVVHAGGPRLVREFGQESGRAGRDGLRSISVVVVAGLKAEKQRRTRSNTREEGWFEAEMEEYIYGDGCRREVIDRVMDGQVGRTECGAGEERCDRCGGLSYDEEEFRGGGG